MTTQTILLDAKALAGELDYGHFQVLYRKLGKQINWREAQPRIPYCTRHGGSFVDPLTGARWSVSCCGLVERDRLLDKSTYDVGMLLLLGGVVYCAKDVAEFWYRYEKKSGCRRSTHRGRTRASPSKSCAQPPNTSLPPTSPTAASWAEPAILSYT